MNYSQAAGGLRIENYLDPNRPDFGDIVLSTSESGSALKRALMALNADVAGTRKLYDASIEATKMGAAGAENLANAGTFAAGLGAGAQALSAGISAIPLPGGGGEVFNDFTDKDSLIDTSSLAGIQDAEDYRNSGGLLAWNSDEPVNVWAKR